MPGQADPAATCRTLAHGRWPGRAAHPAGSPGLVAAPGPQPTEMFMVFRPKCVSLMAASVRPVSAQAPRSFVSHCAVGGQAR